MKKIFRLTPTRQKKLHKLFSFVTIFSLFLQLGSGIFYARPVLSEDIVEPTPTEQVAPTPEPTVEPTSEPTTEPTPTLEASSTVEPSPTPEATPEISPTPTATPILTEEPSPTPIVGENIPPTENVTPPQETGPPQEENPSPTPEVTIEESEQGQLATVVLENVAANSLELDLATEDIEQSASLVTDKADYAPTDTVLISGSDFTPNENYTLTISSTDEPPVNFEAQVTADENGAFVYAYQLDGTYRPNYKVEARNQSGVIVATVTFTDTNGSADACPDDGDWIKFDLIDADTSRTHTTDSGYVIDMVCIKAEDSTVNLPGGSTCHSVSGLDTQTATITEGDLSSSCKNLSHVSFHKAVISTPTNINSIFECWEPDPENEGKYIAYFGWENKSGVEQNIPYGSNNSITPNSYESYFPTFFGIPTDGPRPGRTPFYPNAAITIPNWDGGNIVWKLTDQGTATAGLPGPRCPEIPRPICGDGIIDDEEECDYGELNGDSICSKDCTLIRECWSDMAANGEFEIPEVTDPLGWDIFPSAEVPGWIAEWYGGSGGGNEPKIEIHAGVEGWTSSDDQYVELDSDWDGPGGTLNGEAASISIYQNIPVIAGYEYRVSWSYSPRPNHNDNRLEVKVDGTQAFDSGTIEGGGSVDWHNESYTFVPDSDGVIKISFTETGTPDSYGMFLDNVSIECLGEQIPECVEEGPVWADKVESVTTGTLYNEDPITDPIRIDSKKALGAADGNFYSLGKGGEIILNFYYYIANVSGDDLSVHEITWNRSLDIEETAEVWVKNDHTDWIHLGKASSFSDWNNDGTRDGVNYFDLSDVGLSWINSVKLVESSTGQAGNDDGFDLDAVDATQRVCEEPVIECGDGVKNGKEECDGEDGVTAGENFCTVNCKLVPIYDGEHSCPSGTSPVLEKTISISSKDADGENVSLTGGSGYLLEASGDYIYGQSRLADAAYAVSKTDWSTSVRTDVGIWGTNKGVTSILGDLGSGIGVIEWDDDHSFNTDHVYRKYFSPTTDITANFLISDWYGDWFSGSNNQGSMGDNEGSLSLNVYECVPYSKIFVNKYEDLNKDGKRQLGESEEPGLSNWTFYLYDSEGGLVAGPQKTGPNGWTTFKNVVPGDYSVCEILPAGWVSSDLELNSAFLNNDQQVCRSVTVKPGKDVKNFRFGNYELGKVLVNKYKDLDLNGKRKLGVEEEPGLQGWSFYLYDSEGVLVTGPQQTGPKGWTTFKDIVPGDYRICEQIPDGWISSDLNHGGAFLNDKNEVCKNVTVKSGDKVGNFRFGNYQSSDVEICKVDNKDRPQEGWEVILASEKVDGPTSINVVNSSGTNSADLEAGKYLLKVSGVYRYGNAEMIADAGYSYRPNNIPSGCDCWLSGFDLPSGNGLIVQVDNNTVNWGAFNEPNHEYTYVYDHSSSGPINFSISDNQYGDNSNSGDFQFEIYRIPEGYYGTTESDGCVTLEDIPYGDYILDEILKEGWIDLSGKGSLAMIDTPEESFTLSNRIDAPVKIIASKVVCDSEEYLPNWGSHSSSIDADTAQNYVNDSEDHCQLVDDWKFQYGGIGSSGDFQKETDEKEAPWQTFNVNSDAVINDLSGFGNKIEVREVFPNDEYIGFSNDPGSVGSSVSAEFYCTGDVYNYDNWEYINNPEYGQTYYCVAFNALNKGTIIVEKQTLPDGHQQSFNFSGAVSGSLTDGQQLTTEVVAGSHTVSETNYSTSGYRLVNIDCDDDNSNGDVQNGTATFNIEPGEVVKCTFTNEIFGSITAHKFEDDNQDGAQNGSEVNIGDWPISIYYGSDCLGDAYRQGLTNEQGDIEFYSIVPGNYSVGETLQPGWTNISPLCQNVTVDPGEPERVNFGNFELGKIQGRKFNDLNGNGQEDLGELPINDWTIRLYNSDWEQVSSDQLTHFIIGYGNGRYLFEGLDLGTYYICEVLQPGWTQSDPSDLEGFANQSLNNSTEGSRCRRAIIDESGDFIKGKIFGNVHYGSISGMKFEDMNGDGDKDIEDNGLNGWTIFIDADNNGVLDSGETSSSTDENGNFSFTDLIAGDYQVCEVEQDGWTRTQPSGSTCQPVTVVAGENTPDIDFGNFENGQITACKYDDYNGDGDRDEGEPAIMGVAMSLEKMSEVWVESETGETGEDGCYLFEDLGPGEYRVKEDLADSDLAGYFPTDDWTTDGDYRVSEEMTMTSNNSFTVDYFNDLNPVSLSLDKTHNKVGATVSRGETLNFTLTVKNTADSTAYGVMVRDVLPDGFTYVAGTGEVDGALSEPTISGQQLIWSVGNMTADQEVVVTYNVLISSSQNEGGHPNVAVAYGTNRPAGADDNSTSYSNFAYIYSVVGIGLSYTASIGGGFVLGAATGPAGEVLGAATGSPTYLLIMAIMMILAGLAIMLKKGKKYHV